MAKNLEATEEVQAAIEIACRRRDFRAHRVGCVLRRKDGVVIRYANQCCHVRTPRMHAEARCARKATPGSVAWVVRVLTDGSLAMAKPCRACQVQLKAYGVDRVYYSIGPGEFMTMDLTL